MFFRSVSHESHRKHSSEDQVQGITSQAQAEHQPSVVNVAWKQKFCAENNQLSKYFHCSFVFLFLIIESNELHISNMVNYVADCWY